MKKWFMLLTTILTVIILSHCASVQQLVQPPSVKLESMGLRDLSFQDLTLEFVLLVNNPNRFSIPIKELDYAIWIENETLFEGTQNPSKNMSAQNVTRLPLPLRVEFDRIKSIYGTYNERDSVNYRVAGHLIPGGLFNFKVPFETRGSLPTVQLPKISLKTLQIEQISFGGVDLNLILAIDNPNGFGFSVGSFSYDLSIAGESLVDGETRSLGDIKKHSSGEWRLPLSLSFKGVGTSLRSLVQSSRAEVDLAGKAEIETQYGPLLLPFDVQDTISVIK
jgi:LEA14-like dessication related protein